MHILQYLKRRTSFQEPKTKFISKTLKFSWMEGRVYRRRSDLKDTKCRWGRLGVTETGREDTTKIRVSRPKFFLGVEGREGPRVFYSKVGGPNDRRRSRVRDTRVHGLPSARGPPPRNDPPSPVPSIPFRHPLGGRVRCFSVTPTPTF